MRPALARISHQDDGPRLFFESTRYFLQSAIRTVIPLLQKIPCESKALRDDVQGSTNAV